MKRFIGLMVLVLATVLPCAAQQVVDKMVATVNSGVKTDLITYSDLMWQLALQPNTPLDNPNSPDLNRALRLVIDQRLILQEAEKLPTIMPTPAEISAARNELARNFRTQDEFQQRLLRVGLTSEKLDEIVAENRGGKIAVFSHTGTICILALHLMGALDSPELKPVWISSANCGISRFELRDDGFVRVLALNDTNHLQQ